MVMVGDECIGAKCEFFRSYYVVGSLQDSDPAYYVPMLDLPPDQYCVHPDIVDSDYVPGKLFGSKGVKLTALKHCPLKH